jgi:hypothetical protein
MSPLSMWLPNSCHTNFAAVFIKNELTLTVVTDLITVKDRFRKMVLTSMILSRASDSAAEAQDLNTGKIKEWRSIITLIVFVLTSELSLLCAKVLS